MRDVMDNNKETKMKLILCALFLLASCSPLPNKDLPMETPEASNPYVLRYVGGFQDDSAYHGSRGVYVLTEKETGRQWVGVSGIGISELGSHIQHSGKMSHTVPDER